jgi:uncharacterized protein (UPF0147 family)
MSDASDPRQCRQVRSLSETEILQTKEKILSVLDDLCKDYNLPARGAIALLDAALDDLRTTFKAYPPDSHCHKENCRLHD